MQQITSLQNGCCTDNSLTYKIAVADHVNELFGHVTLRLTAAVLVI